MRPRDIALATLRDLAQHSTQDERTASLIQQYENDELANLDVLRLFASLIKSGEVWEMEEHYARQALAFIRSGRITRTGEFVQ